MPSGWHGKDIIQLLERLLPRLGQEADHEQKRMDVEAGVEAKRALRLYGL
jgi:hypothetical protein